MISRFVSTAREMPGVPKVSRSARMLSGESERVDGLRRSTGSDSGRRKNAQIMLIALRPAATKQGTGPARPLIV